MGHQTMASGWVASKHDRSRICVGPDLSLIDTVVVDNRMQHSGVNRLQVEDREIGYHPTSTIQLNKWLVLLDDFYVRLNILFCMRSRT
jgi:hypothetical protein